MICQECNQTLSQLDNEHLLNCCGLTLQEYAIRYHLPLDGLVSHDLLNVADNPDGYTKPSNPPSEYDRAVLYGLQLAGALQVDDLFDVIEGEVRRLDELLWYQKALQAYGFQYRQEFLYTQQTHRVVAKNRLKVPCALFQTLCKEDRNPRLDMVSLATLIAYGAQYRGGYVFLELQRNRSTEILVEWLAQEYQIRMVRLDSICDNDKLQILRTESLTDANRLLAVVKQVLSRIPCAADRFYAQVDHATVSKELVFDSAHFITDHAGKCVNLHGGRYSIHVKVKGRIDPLSGFVVDYGFLKKVVQKQVIEQLDHHNLNYVNSDLAWRSSTELLNIFIWERLIHYLPELCELQTYETTQSFCVYQGPSLDQMQNHLEQPALKHFSQPGLGKSALRSLINQTPSTETAQLASGKSQRAGEFERK